MTPDPVAEQLSKELTDRAWPLGDLLGPNVADYLVALVRAASQTLAAQLIQTEDSEVAAQTAADVIGVLWPDAPPERLDYAEWWRTPLGLACARSLGIYEVGGAVSHSAAATMLGVARGTVATLVHRGTLARHPTGGISRASVLARLARRPSEPWTRP